LTGLFPSSIPKIIFGHKHFKNNDLPPIKGFKREQKDGKQVKIHVLTYKNDYIFHTLKCHRKGSNKKLKEIMKKQRIFILNSEEVSKAVLDILKKYKFMFSNRSSFNSNEEYSEFQKNYEKTKFKNKFFARLVAFIRPFKYHHNTYNKLTKLSLKTIEKYLLNKWYQSRIIDSQELKYGVSAQFKEIVDFFEKRKLNQNKERMISFSGHDTNLVNFISNVLDSEFLKEKINSSLENKLDYNFLVPPLASSIILELHQSLDESSNYFINLIYNGKAINNQKFRKNVKIDEESGLLNYNNFRDVLKSRIDESFRSLVCGSRLVVK
jgi:hypothetical protein